MPYQSSTGVENWELSQKGLGFAARFHHGEQRSTASLWASDSGNKLNDCLMRDSQGVIPKALPEQFCGNALLAAITGIERVDQ